MATPQFGYWQCQGVRYSILETHTLWTNNDVTKEDPEVFVAFVDELDGRGGYASVSDPVLHQAELIDEHPVLDNGRIGPMAYHRCRKRWQKLLANLG